MNIKAFKKLIKEAVVEAIYEELPDIMNEVLAKQQKQALREGRSLNFTSADIQPSGLPKDVRNQLAGKLGESFGFGQPQAFQPSSLKKLEVIDAVDESTGEKVNPFLAFIADSAANLTPQEKAGLKNLG